MNSLMQTFSEKFELLSFAEKKVFFYLENHRSDLRNQTLADIAERNSVSTTTVIRMCHKLGLQGFSELKYQLNKKNFSKEAPVNSSESFSRCLIDSIGQIDENQIDELANRIVRAQRVHIACLGLSKMIGEYFLKVLTKEDKNCSMSAEPFLIDVLPRVATPEDVVIIISASGQTKHLLNLAENLKFNFTPSVLITGNPSALISQYATTTIYSSSENLVGGKYPYHHTSLLFVVDLILNAHHRIAYK